MHHDAPPPGRSLPFLLGVLATISSLCFSFLILPHLAGPLAVNMDPDKLGELGRNLAEGRGFSYGTAESITPAFDRAPVYPLLVMLLFRITGENPLPLLQIIQAFFHGLTGYLLYRIGLELFERRIALLGQAIHAVHPILLWYTARIWIETTNTMVITALVLALFVLRKRETRWTLMGCGVLFALAMLTKSVALVLPVAVLLVAAVRKEWTYARSLALACLIGLVLVSPWTVRNYLLSGRFIPVHTSLGLNFVQGEAIARHWTETPFSTLAIWEKGRAEGGELLASGNQRPESPEGDALLTAAILQRWWRDPVTLLRHAAANAVTFWYLSESPLKSGVILLLQVPLLVFGVRGMRRMRLRAPAMPILCVSVLSFWIVHALVVGWLRYSVPVLPLMILCAAAGLGRLSSAR